MGEGRVAILVASCIAPPLGENTDSGCRIIFHDQTGIALRTSTTAPGISTSESVLEYGLEKKKSLGVRY